MYEYTFAALYYLIINVQKYIGSPKSILFVAVDQVRASRGKCVVL